MVSTSWLTLIIFSLTISFNDSVIFLIINCAAIFLTFRYNSTFLILGTSRFLIKLLHTLPILLIRKNRTKKKKKAKFRQFISFFPSLDTNATTDLGFMSGGRSISSLILSYSP